jgi:hypothetical protein
MHQHDLMIHSPVLEWGFNSLNATVTSPKVLWVPSVRRPLEFLTPARFAGARIDVAVEEAKDALGGGLIALFDVRIDQLRRPAHSPLAGC